MTRRHNENFDILLFICFRCEILLVLNNCNINMDNTFKLSLLWVLLIIPQHGNSPTPRVESWMEMDQGDGFVDREFTSSLTGAESFGSAHKIYQNALIRKKQNHGEGESLGDGIVQNFVRSEPDRIYGRAAMTQNFVPNQYDYLYSKNMVPQPSPNGESYVQLGDNMNAYQGNRYRLNPLGERGQSTNKRFSNKYRWQTYSDSIRPGKNMRSLRGRNVEDENKALRSSRMADYYLLGGRRMGPDDAAMDSLQFRDENEYVAGNQETVNRVKGELDDDDLKELEEQEPGYIRYGKEDDDPEMEEYYSDQRNPIQVRDAADVLDMEYNEINPHGIIYKREQGKEKQEDKGEEVSQGSIGENNKGKSVTGFRSENILAAVAPKESHEITKTDAKELFTSADMMQNMNSDVHSKELGDVVKESQRALDEVQLFQQKLAAKPHYGYLMEWRGGDCLLGKKRCSNDMRNKREDEDEQKNMKTGTDEGGGEYEDEEGKGHNDEEEYYEEVEFSGGKNGETGERPGQRIHKRESGKDGKRKSSERQGAQDKLNSDFYELNLKNAPVENEGKVKSHLREEGSQKKVVARKGMKVWDEWSKWSPCSVTCGVGRMTRWRHCIGGGCAQGEKEALIKKCTFPAC